MKKTILLVVFLCLIGNSGSTDSDGEAPVGIEVIDNADDVIGSRLIYHIREIIRKSEGYYLSNSNQNRLILNVLATDPFESIPEDRGHISVTSVIWTMGYKNNEYCQCYFSSTIGYCGANRVKEAAEAIVAEADDYLSRFWNLVYEWYSLRYPNNNMDSALDTDSL